MQWFWGCVGWWDTRLMIRIKLYTSHSQRYVVIFKGKSPHNSTCSLRTLCTAKKGAGLLELRCFHSVFHVQKKTLCEYWVSCVNCTLLVPRLQIYYFFFHWSHSNKLHVTIIVRSYGNFCHLRLLSCNNIISISLYIYIYIIFFM